jgi:hypothetical protein
VRIAEDVMSDSFSDKRLRQPAPDYEPDDLAGDESRWAEDDALTTEPDDPLAFGDPHMVQLGGILDFGPGDLACNQDGVLSPAQIARLENEVRLFYGPMIAGVAAAAFILGLIGIANGLWAVLLVALLGMGLAALPAALLRRERQRLPRGLVRHSTMRIGSFTLTMRRWGISDSDSLPVDSSKPIFGPKQLYKVLKGNQTYIVYYAPVRTWRGHRLLSLEPIADDVPVKTKRKPKRQG